MGVKVNQNAAADFTDNADDAEAAQDNNLQTFTRSLGGLPPPVTKTAGAAKPLSVKATIHSLSRERALNRSCAVQHNSCANASNRREISESVGQCDAQQAECNAAAA